MSTLTLGGRYPEMYTLTDNCTTLAAGASCTATVSFKPTTYDLREASVILTGDLSLEDLKKEVLVTGTGIVIDAPNDTARQRDRHRSTLPFYSGVQVQDVDPATPSLRAVPTTAPPGGTSSPPPRTRPSS